MRGRRTGILAKGGPGLIEDNRFDDPRYPKPLEIRQSTAVTGRDAGE